MRTCAAGSSVIAVIQPAEAAAPVRPGSADWRQLSTTRKIWVGSRQPIQAPGLARRHREKGAQRLGISRRRTNDAAGSSQRDEIDLVFAG